MKHKEQIFHIGGQEIILKPGASGSAQIASVTIAADTDAQRLFIANAILDYMRVSNKEKRFGTHPGHHPTKASTEILMFDGPKDPHKAQSTRPWITFDDISGMLSVLQQEIPDPHTLDTALTVDNISTDVTSRKKGSKIAERAVAPYVEAVTDFLDRRYKSLSDDEKEALARELAAVYQRQRGHSGP